MEHRKISEIANVKTGYQDNKDFHDTWNSYFSLIQGKDFSGGKLRSQSLDKIRPMRNPELYKIFKGDILFQARGDEHFAWSVDRSLPETMAAYTFYILRMKTSEITAGFLAWWLNQSQAQVYFKTQAGTGMVSFVSVKALAELQVPVIAMDLQLKVEALSTLQQSEETLLDQLKVKRKQLANKICLDAIKIQEKP